MEMFLCAAEEERELSKCVAVETDVEAKRKVNIKTVKLGNIEDDR